MHDPVQTFSHKYEATSWAGRRLINGFYRQLEQLYRQVDSEHPKVLEVACGPGYSTRWISEWVPPSQLYASDVEPSLVQEAAERVPTAQIKVESIYETTRADEEFDVVFALEVLEHLDTPGRALEEISRITNQYAIISVPREPVWRALNLARGKYVGGLGNTPGHINHWGRQGFEELLSRHFDILDRRFPLPWQMYLLRKKSRQTTD